MDSNISLGAANVAKNDEFHTQYADIQKEINAYLEYNPDTFRDKVVLLPCDYPEWSNFTKFFVQNFELLGLKKIISTPYAVERKRYKFYEPTLFETESPHFDANHPRIWKFAEMDADHVTAWSKGCETDISNCQMLSKTHNCAKSNR